MSPLGLCWGLTPASMELAPEAAPAVVSPPRERPWGHTVPAGPAGLPSPGLPEGGRGCRSVQHGSPQSRRFSKNTACPGCFT